MKTRNIKLVTFGFAAMLLASCSDSNDTPNPTPNPAETGIIGKEVTSITDAQQLAARVYNFKRPSATRAAGVTYANLIHAYTMEAEPTGLDFAKMDKMDKYESWNFPANTDMYIAPGETIASNNYHLDGNTIYVAGTYEYNPGWTEGNYTIVVLKRWNTKMDRWKPFSSSERRKNPLLRKLRMQCRPGCSKQRYLQDCRRFKLKRTYIQSEQCQCLYRKQAHLQQLREPG